MMRLIAAVFAAAALLLLAPTPGAEALSGYCPKRCMPAFNACKARHPDSIGFCNKQWRRCSYRCMGIRF